MKLLEILKVNDQHRFQCLTLMYNMLKGVSPDVYEFKENLNNNLRDRGLRSSVSQPNNVRLPGHSSMNNKNSFSSLGPLIWNNSSEELKSIDSSKRFKKEVRKDILQSYAEKCICSNPLCVDRRFHQV